MSARKRVGWAWIWWMKWMMRSWGLGWVSWTRNMPDFMYDDLWTKRHYISDMYNKYFSIHLYYSITCPRSLCSTLPQHLHSTPILLSLWTHQTCSCLLSGLLLLLGTSGCIPSALHPDCLSFTFHLLVFGIASKSP